MITVTIQRKDLEKADACGGGLGLFDSIKALADEQRKAEGKAARKGVTIRWSRLHALWLATAYPEYSRWLIDMGIVPAISFRGANLDGANLIRANLYGANLDGANLIRANLDGAKWPTDKTPPDGYTVEAQSCGCCARLRKAT